MNSPASETRRDSIRRLKPPPTDRRRSSDRRVLPEVPPHLPVVTAGRWSSSLTDRWVKLRPSRDGPSSIGATTPRGHGRATLAVAEGRRVRLARRPQEQEQGGEGEEMFLSAVLEDFLVHISTGCAPGVSALQSWECVWPRPNNVSR